MRILQLRRASEGPNLLVAQFGIGLLGSSILRALSSRAQLSAERQSFSWASSSRWGAEFEAIATRLERILELGSATELAIVWSAGRVGFSASPAEIEVERACYEEALDWAAGLPERFGTSVSFHLISSAGGLFEGSGLVTCESQPAPRRPYGQFKLQQELALRARQELIARIYRPTSVYGFLDPRHRQGLVQTLLLRTIRHEVTSVYGSMSTLRDFVFSEDVGEFVARQVLELDASARDTFLLGSGKPSSIYEVQRVVERLLGRRLYVQVSSAPSNSANLCYSSNTFPPDWRPSELWTGIRQVHARWIQRGLPREPLREQA